MKIYAFIILFLHISLNSFAQKIDLINTINAEKDKIENCYSKLENDTLIIGNSFIERRFKWNNGNIISIAIVDKLSKNTIKITNDNQSDFSINKLKLIPTNNNYQSSIVDATPIISSHLNTQIVTKYQGLEVKQVFKIFPSSLGISCEYHLKKTDNNLKFNIKDINIEQLQIENIHWEMEAVEFIDNTDHNNTLVKKEKLIPFETNNYVGNILYMSSLQDSKGLFFLKEAPCSNIQLNYPGYDFVSQRESNTTIVKSVGLGVKPQDLIVNEWVKTFSYVVGVHNNEDLGKKTALRSYQFNNRILKPERDEMIMVNTWGDRNKDTKLCEQFIIDELKKAHEFGFTHYQIDDGWQQGLSKNSGVSGKTLWDEWSLEDWLPHKERFPNGFTKILKLANSLQIKIGLWFHPSNENDYKNWEQDANIVLNIYHKFGIKNIKIDGVKLPTKKADINLERFYNKILKESNNNIIFNVDATADSRYGYHYNNHIGNIFLENRYTDWKTYYPYQTLRNIWMLANYVPLQKIQLEFLNKWRKADIYGNDPYAPANYSFDYIFAITMPCQPLAWFETTGLPKEAEKSIALFHNYKSISAELHNAQIFSIGNEPNGKTFTGFQFLTSDDSGYVLVFRELNDINEFKISTLLNPGEKVEFTKIFGNGFDFKTTIDDDKKVLMKLDEANSFCLYSYKRI